jgi:hypothetical protein
MSELFTKYVAQEQQEQKLKTRSAGKRMAGFTIVATAVDPQSLSDCGNACHTAVKAKDYIFHPYQKR